ncbi:MAG: pyridoxamine 5'-phosphate oxidase family protein [Odoribacteraceae bacterium]|nr:pyridoxamine 5'-phosphate oxidase family protein [Odoribacteraceae bacterium]
MKHPEDTIGNLIDSQNVSFISSVDEEGFPNTKAMLAPCKREGITTFYWHTNGPSTKVKQYRHNPKACVYFYDKRFFRAVMLKGTMEIVDDTRVKQALWQDEYAKYYTGGADGGDYTLLKFTAETGRYYCNFHSTDFKTHAI